MKKLSKILGMIACAFVIIFSGAMLTACGGGAYNIKGTTLKGTAECKIVWGENATQQNKEAMWSKNGVTNDDELAQKFAEQDGEFYETWKCIFNNDGSLEVTLTEHEDPETETWYFTQTEDFNTIQTYFDAELTDSFLSFDYIDGEYMLNISEYDYLAIYFAFERV